MLTTGGLPMFIKNWKKEILTIPNLLSLFRLLLIPVYVHLYRNAVSQWHYAAAAGIMALSCLTDLLDGKIARRFHMVTQVGKVLDPLADKFTQLALFLCLSSRYPLLEPVLMLFLVKEIFQLIAGLLHLRRGKILPGALMAGKICTTVLFISLIALVLFPRLNASIVEGIITLDGAFLLFSFVCYVQAYYGKSKKIQDIEKP